MTRIDKLALAGVLVGILGGLSALAVDLKTLLAPAAEQAAAGAAPPGPAPAPAADPVPLRAAADPAAGSAPAAPPRTDLPQVPVLAPLAAAPALPGWQPERAARFSEGTTATVCARGLTFAFSVAKIGTRADTGIYLTSPAPSGRIEVGEDFALSDDCRLRLDRTGRTSGYFAEFTFVGSLPQ